MNKRVFVSREEKMNRLRCFVLMTISLFMMSGFLAAQQATGKIIGSVRDEQGLALPGVNVVATAPSVMGELTTTTDAEGTFRFLACPPGSYKITFTLPGFKKVIQENVVLVIERTLTLTIQMDPTELREEILVVAESPLVDVKSTTKGMTLTKDIFSSLPRGRNFNSLMTVIPGVQVEDSLGGTSVDGASGLENMYYIDGMDSGDIVYGNEEQDAAFEFVEEIQIKSSGYQAEFGGSMGGVVNVVTRSGGNQFSGEVIGYYEGSKLTGKERDSLRLNPFDVKQAEYVNYQDLYGKDKVNRYEFGLSIGGYILRDRLWFYGSVLPVFRNRTRNVEWLSGDPASSHTEKYRWNNFLGKITAQPTSFMRVAATFVNNSSTYTGSLPSRDGSDDATYPWGETGYDFPNLTATLSSDFVFGNNLLVSVRGGHFRYDQKNQKIKPEGPRYTFSDTNAIYPDLVEMYPEYIRASGFSSYPNSAGYETKKKLYTRTSANIDMTYYFALGGEHAFKAGYQFVRLTNDMDDTFTYGRFSFNWGQDYYIPGQEDVFYMGEYGYYTVYKYPDYGRYGKVNSYRHAFYLQDSWTIANKLTINYGVRAEREDVPSYYEGPIKEYEGLIMQWDFFDKLAPRFGLIYDVFGDSSLKVFGSWAIYYDALKLALADGAYGATRRRYHVYTLDDPQWWTYGINDYYPGTHVNYVDHYLPSFDETDKSMKATSQSEITLGVERKLTEDISVSARFVRKHLIRVIEDMGVIDPGGTIWIIANPGYGFSLRQSEGGMLDDKYPNTPKAKREYAAVNISVEKRLSNNWMAGFNYTWSRLWGNFTGLAFSGTGQQYPNETTQYDRWYRERDANMNPIDDVLFTDRTHNFKFYGSYNFDFGLTVGTVANFYSGVPISRRVDSPSYWWPDGKLTDGRSPFIFATDFYAEYNLRFDKYTFQVNLNVTNILNIDTARNVFSDMTRIRIPASDEDLLSGTFDYSQYLTDDNRDARFLKEYDFFPPIEARIGFKFIF